MVGKSRCALGEEKVMALSWNSLDYLTTWDPQGYAHNYNLSKQGPILYTFYTLGAFLSYTLFTP